jgi:hypothetical protein
VHEHQGAGHLFTDRSLPDHDATAAARTWSSVLTSLEALV